MRLTWRPVDTWLFKLNVYVWRIMPFAIGFYVVREVILGRPLSVKTLAFCLTATLSAFSLTHSRLKGPPNGGSFKSKTGESGAARFEEAA